MTKPPDYKISLIRDINVPKVFIEERAMQKIKEYVRQRTTEIGWLGCVREEVDEETKEISLTIYDVYAPKQEVSSATADISEEGVVDYTMKVLKDGGETDDVGRYWGHSHVNMGVTPSGTDDDTLAEMVENDERYFIMSIHNKNNASYCAIYLGNGLVIKDVTMTVLYEDNGVADEVAKEIEDNVNTRVVTPINQTTGNITYAKPNTTNGNSSNASSSKPTDTHTGRGSDRVSSGANAIKDGNFKANSVGL